MTKKEPYSYHTFLYPFLLKCTYEDFRKSLDQADSKWEAADMIVDEGKHLATVKNNSPIEEQMLDYQTFQYFNSAARKALFEREENIESSIVSSYNLKNSQNGIYCITYKGKDYRLKIDAIRLKVFNTNVAVISFELEYFLPEDGNEKQARNNIKIINEFGRRLYPEFLTTEETDFLLCADKIALELPRETPIIDNLREKAMLPKDTYLKDPIHLPNIITKIVWLDEDKIEPAVDDRMFVCCCVMDDEYTKSFIHSADQKASTPQEHKWCFQEDWNTACELYALTNIDSSAGSASCQNRVMFDQYFEEQLYLRWIEWGTIHAVTNHSMICLTGKPESVKNSVVNPFLVLYVPMCILGLAQRASLLNYDAAITDAIKNALSKEMDVTKVIDLAERFSIFKGQLLLSEVTPQIQGIEIYERIQKMLFIPSLVDNIQRQLDNLYQIAEARRDKQESEKQNVIGTAFSALAILTLLSTWMDASDFVQRFPIPFVSEENEDIFTFIFAAACFLIVSLIAFISIKFSANISNWILKKAKKKKGKGK